jgi:hypothetical protein
MAFETTAIRLWKRLTPAERLAAATAFWKEPPQEVLGSALGVLIKARHLRPQAARTLAPEAQARILATVLDPGEGVAAALLVALHLGERRPLLAAFLDAIGLAHENGILKDDAASEAPLAEDKARAGVRQVSASFPRAEVETYLNTLWLQDPERWAVLAASPEWLEAPPA